MGKITYIDEVAITEKRVLFRADFDVPLTHDHTIANDFRIRINIFSIQYLLKQHNKIIIIAKLGRPKQRESHLSLKVVVQRLQTLLPETKVRLIRDFLTEPKKTFLNQKEDEIFVLENIRFYPEEKRNEKEFAKRLAALGDAYVNDGFAMCHRAEASIVGIPEFLPSYAGLSLKREILMLTQAIKNPKRPLVAIIGGAKISTKLTLITRLIENADYVLLGGGLANVFFRAQRYLIGRSICEYEMVLKARQMLFLAAQKHTAIILPSDVVVGDPKNPNVQPEVIQIGEKFPKNLHILDIGPETQARFGNIINKAKTIIWNGPVGLFENPQYRQGTDFVYYAITHSPQAASFVGGGDTLAAIDDKKHRDKILHISSGGGAMLEFIEKKTLPGIEALKQ